MSRLTDVLDADAPWPEKRDQLIDFPYADVPVQDRDNQILDAHDEPDTIGQLRLAVSSGRLTIAQYGEVLDGLRAHGKF